MKIQPKATKTVNRFKEWFLKAYIDAIHQCN